MGARDNIYQYRKHSTNNENKNKISKSVKFYANSLISGAKNGAFFVWEGRFPCLRDVNSRFQWKCSVCIICTLVWLIRMDIWNQTKTKWRSSEQASGNNNHHQIQLKTRKYAQTLTQSLNIVQHKHTHKHTNKYTNERERVRALTLTHAYKCIHACRVYSS